MSLCQVDSTEAPFVQLADVFAGMAAYTRKNPEIVWSLLAKPEGQYELGFTRTDIPLASNPLTRTVADLASSRISISDAKGRDLESR